MIDDVINDLKPDDPPRYWMDGRRSGGLSRDSQGLGVLLWLLKVASANTSMMDDQAANPATA